MIKQNNNLEVSASIWSADLGALEKSIKAVDKYVNSYHFDFMDNRYVRGLLFCPAIIRALRSYTDKEFQAHLMIFKPETMVEELCDVGIDTVMIHFDSCNKLPALIDSIKKLKMKIGLVLKNGESIETIRDYLDICDYIVVMGTTIGVKGQDFDESNYIKITNLFKIRRDHRFSYKIQIDGGIRDKTVPLMYKHGADAITAGSLLFNNDYDEFYNWVCSLDSI